MAKTFQAHQSLQTSNTGWLISDHKSSPGGIGSKFVLELTHSFDISLLDQTIRLQLHDLGRGRPGQVAAALAELHARRRRAHLRGGQLQAGATRGGQARAAEDRQGHDEQGARHPRPRQQAGLALGHGGRQAGGRPRAAERRARGRD